MSGYSSCGLLEALATPPCTKVVAAKVVSSPHQARGGTESSAFVGARGHEDVGRVWGGEAQERLG